MPDDLQELKRLIAELTQRVYRLEQAAGMAEAAPPAAPVTATAPLPPPVAVPGTPPPPSEDLESKIGSHWFNRIGIVAVLVGVALFLKYAFENNWIGPAGRVSIGLMGGLAV